MVSPPLSPLLATKAFRVSGKTLSFVVEADYERRAMVIFTADKRADNHVAAWELAAGEGQGDQLVSFAANTHFR